jgi:hypothetical protein
MEYKCTKKKRYVRIKATEARNHNANKIKAQGTTPLDANTQNL